MDQGLKGIEKARLTLTNGDVYEGFVKQNKKGVMVPHGHGAYYYTLENKKYEGEFNMGKKDGEGFFVYEENDEEKEYVVYANGKLISRDILLTNKDVEGEILSKLSTLFKKKEAPIFNFVDSQKTSDKINVILDNEGVNSLLFTDKLLTKILSSDLSLLKKYSKKFSSFEDLDGEKVWVVSLQNLTKERDKRFLKLINDKILNSKIEIPNQDLQDNYLTLLQSIGIDIDIIAEEVASAGHEDLSDQHPKIDASILAGDLNPNFDNGKQEKFRKFANALEVIAPKIKISFQDIVFEPVDDKQNWLVRIPKKYLDSANISSYSKYRGSDKQYYKIPFQYIRDEKEFEKARSAILGDEIFSSFDVRKRIDFAWNSLKNGQKESLIIGEKKYDLKMPANDTDRSYNTYSIDGKDIQYSVEFFGLFGKVLETVLHQNVQNFDSSAQSENKLDNRHPLEVALEKIRPAKMSFLYDISINLILDGKEEKWFVTIPKEYLDPEAIKDYKKIMINRGSDWLVPLSHVINHNNKEFNFVAGVILGDEVFDDNFAEQIDQYKNELRQQGRILENKRHGKYFKLGSQEFYLDCANEKYSGGIIVKMIENALMGVVRDEEGEVGKKHKENKTSQSSVRGDHGWVEEYVGEYLRIPGNLEKLGILQDGYTLEGVKKREEQELLQREDDDLALAIQMSLEESKKVPKTQTNSATADKFQPEKAQEGKRK